MKSHTVINTIVAIEVGHNGVYNVVSRDVFSDNSLGVIKGQLGSYTCPVDACIYQQLFNDPMGTYLMEQMKNWTQEKWADFKAKVRAQLYADNDKAKALRAKLNLS